MIIKSLSFEERDLERFISLHSRNKLVETAKIICRDLRRNSTKAEKIFWEAVRNRKFYGKKFYRQYPIFHDITGKETFFITDFYCFEEKFIDELYGEYHQYKLKEDKERTRILNYLGSKIIRFNNGDIIKNLTNVLEKIK